ncbi:MAG: biopolymer transporter ExbD [Legionellales bacterium]|nr:biopolymer transporter ExbD [Legionellales bacterium]|tara:strand:+ start:1482 stop:1886 length:405 start_codon:yes stop_codon:yes gene_type:complete
MKHTQSNQESAAESVNLTPLIDMVFILLIFFLVTASFTKESGIDVDRPTAKTAAREEQGSMIIGVSKDGEIWIDSQKIDMRAVRAHVEHLHAQNPEGTVIILADQSARTGTTVEVLDQVRLAGVTNVSIAASNE